MPQRGQMLWNGPVLRFELFVLRRILLVPPTPSGITLKNVIFHSTMNINSSSVCDDDFFQTIIERKNEDIVAAIFPTLLGLRWSATECDHDQCQPGGLSETISYLITGEVFLKKGFSILNRCCSINVIIKSKSYTSSSTLDPNIAYP